MLIDLLRTLFDWRNHKLQDGTIIFLDCILKVPFAEMLKGTTIQQIVCREKTLFLYTGGTNRVFPITINVENEVFL